MTSHRTHQRPAPHHGETQGRAGRLQALVLALVLTGGLPAGGAYADGPAPATETVRALIKPRSQAVLSSEITGRITRLPLREGERFRSGDMLAEFDCNWFMAAQAAAQAGVNHAQAKLSGLESLAAMRSVGAMDVSLARADLDRARAELRTAGLSVKHCVVTAPFDGRVVELRAQAFETVPANTPLLSILNDTDLEVSLVVPATWLTWIAPDQPFTLDIDETRRRYTGRITRLGAHVDPVSQTVTVFGSIAGIDRTVIAGMSGTVRVIPPATLPPPPDPAAQ